MSMLLTVGGLVIGAIIAALIMDGRRRYQRMMRQVDRDRLAGVTVEWAPLPIPDDETARWWAHDWDQPNPRGGLR
jgi:hypothetical protein